MQEMEEKQVWSLGGEYPLEEGLATPSSVLTWRVPWTEEPGSYSLQGHKESDTTEAAENACFGERSMKSGTGNCGLQGPRSSSPPSFSSQGCSSFAVGQEPPPGAEMVPSHHVSEVRPQCPFYERGSAVWRAGGWGVQDSVREMPVGQKGSFPARLDPCFPRGLGPGAQEPAEDNIHWAPRCPCRVAPAVSLQGPRVDTRSSRETRHCKTEMPVSFLKGGRQSGDIFVTLQSSSFASVLTGESAPSVLGTPLCGELKPCFAEMLRHTPTPSPDPWLPARDPRCTYWEDGVCDLFFNLFPPRLFPSVEGFFKKDFIFLFFLLLLKKKKLSCDQRKQFNKKYFVNI